MSKPGILVVEPEARSRESFEFSLRKAGFVVTTAVSAADALQRTQVEKFQAVISGIDLPGGIDGPSLCGQLRQQPGWADVPFLLVSDNPSAEERLRALELGSVTYLTKPLFMKELILRLRAVLRTEQATTARDWDPRTTLRGDISDMAAMDLIQAMEIGRKSGVLHLFRQRPPLQGAIFFSNGTVVDGEVGHLRGSRAVYRMLGWSNGRFEVSFDPVNRERTIDEPTQALLLEGMRQLDEWRCLAEQLPPLDAVLDIDLEELRQQQNSLPDDVLALLSLFDGQRTIGEVIDTSELDDLEAGHLLSKLFFAGLLVYQASPGVISLLDNQPSQVAQPTVLSGELETTHGDSDSGALELLPPVLVQDLLNLDGSSAAALLPDAASLARFRAARNEEAIANRLDTERSPPEQPLTRAGTASRLSHAWPRNVVLAGLVLITLGTGIAILAHFIGYTRHPRHDIISGKKTSYANDSRRAVGNHTSSSGRHASSVFVESGGRGLADAATGERRAPPTSSEGAHFGQGTAAEKHSSHDVTAGSQLRHLLGSPEAWEHLPGWRKREVARQLRKTLASAPDDWRALQMLAYIELQYARDDRALELALRAAEVSPGAPYVQLVIAVIAQQRGMPRAAKVAYRRFLRLCPECPQSKTVRSVLKEL